MVCRFGDLFSSPGMTTLTRHSQLAAYPVLLPIYLMGYDVQIPEETEAMSFMCIVQAHSKDVRGTPLPHSFTHIDYRRRL